MNLLFVEESKLLRIIFFENSLEPTFKSPSTFKGGD